jgi:hypothetical protein
MSYFTMKIERIVFLDNLGGDRDLFIKGSRRDRDNSTVPWVMLKESFLSEGLDLIMFKDLESLESKDLILELNYTGLNQNPSHSIIILTEPLSICKDNFNLEKLDSYQVVFSVFEFHKKLQNYRPLFYPVISKEILTVNEDFFWTHNRSDNLCIIANNYTSFIGDSMYAFRLNLVKEGLKIGKLDVYGSYWMHLFPPIVNGRRTVNFLRRQLSLSLLVLMKMFVRSSLVIPMSVNSKKEVYVNYKFVLCVENSIHDGYITEKIFDAMTCGCVPIYLGAKNICDFIPNNLFISLDIGDSFETIMEKVYACDYLELKRNAHDFLYSENSNNFKAETFSETLTKAVLSI